MRTDRPSSFEASMSLGEGPPSPQKIDYDIWLQGGTTTAFDSILPHAHSEEAGNPKCDWVVTLNRENGKLQHESCYYKTLVEDVLIRLLPLIWLHSCDLHRLTHGRDPEIGGPNTSLRFSPPAHVVNSGKSALGTMATETYLPPHRYNHGSVRTPNMNEPRDLFHMNSSLYLKPYTFNYGENTIATRQLLVQLTRENGKLRHRLAQDRYLVIRVLMYLIPQLLFHCDSLYSVIQMFDQKAEKPARRRQERAASFTSEVQSIDFDPTTLKQNLHSNKMRLGCHPYTCNAGLTKCSINGRKTKNPKDTTLNYIDNLKHNIKELRFQYYHYGRLVNYGLNQIFPLVQFHSDKLRFMARKSNEEVQKVEYLCE